MRRLMMQGLTDAAVGCTRCNQRWSVTSGTVMADTKLPLTHWFRAMHLMTSTKQGISAIELGRRLGVSYRAGCRAGGRQRPPYGRSR